MDNNNIETKVATKVSTATKLALAIVMLGALAAGVLGFEKVLKPDMDLLNPNLVRELAPKVLIRWIETGLEKNYPYLLIAELPKERGFKAIYVKSEDSDLLIKYQTNLSKNKNIKILGAYEYDKVEGDYDPRELESKLLMDIVHSWYDKGEMTYEALMVANCMDVAPIVPWHPRGGQDLQN